MNRIEMPIRPFSLEEEEAAGAVPPHPVATIIVAVAREEMRVKRVARFVTMMLLKWVGCSTNWWSVSQMPDVKITAVA